MRTTITLDDELLKELKKSAAASGKTLSEVIADAARESLARRETTGRRGKVTLPTFRPNVPGVQPGVDLDDSAGLLDLMDEWDASHRR